MQSKATTVQQYLGELPPDRREAISAVREVILRNLDKDYEEGMTYGMIGYYVPHRVYPAGYHCDPRQPLPFANLASQKNYMSLYLMSVYCGCDGGKETEHAKWFRETWVKSGKKLDMGKACLRFKKTDDLALDVIGEAIRRVPAKLYIDHVEAAWGKHSDRKSAAAKSKSPKRTKAVSQPGSSKKASGKKPIRKSKKASGKAKSKR